MTAPFSAEIPRLLQVHLEHLTSSAISIDVIQERGYSSVLGKTALRDAGFSKSQQRAPGILIPLHGVDGSVIGHQYRPDKPREDTKRGRLIKYENPTGSSVRLDIPPRCRGELGNPAGPVWFTEGVKKVDSLASAGACAVGLTGVWGFKGRNPLGGTTILADFDYIALKDRDVYLVFDSDSSSNAQVRMALSRLRDHLARKGARVHLVQLQPGASDEKTGADDYLARGHTLEDLVKLEVQEPPSSRPTLRQHTNDIYCIEGGRICWIKQSQDGEVTVPLCNFTARITEVVTRDNGVDLTKSLTVIGVEGSGEPLPIVEVPTTGFESMGWVTAEWDTRAIISASQTAKARLREAMLLQSQDATRRDIFTHTGWRDIGGTPVYLSAGGAIGIPNIEVEVEEGLKNYCLPPLAEDPAEALRASYEFLSIASPRVTFPLWASMYLAPLSAILEPAFTLFLVGHSGSFKSTLSALALNHYGQRFDEFHLPAAWRDTENKLEKLLFLAKDMPLIIDDWAPGSDSAKARELEVKAEHVIRAQGNRQGRGRLRSDTSSRKTYIPRGLLITSGEQLPSGHSHTARIFAIELDGGDIDRDRLTAAQQQKHLYSLAMSHYIAWLQKQWDILRKDLPKQFLAWRDQVRSSSHHPRLPGVVANLYAGLSCALDFMAEQGVVTEDEAKKKAEEGLGIFIGISSEQAGRVEEERPAKRFIEALRTLVSQGKAVLWSKDDEAPRKLAPGETMVGWTDTDGHVMLNPGAAYAAVRQYSQYADAPFTYKQNAVWKDLRQLNYIEYLNGRNTVNARIYNRVEKVIKLRKWALQGNNSEQQNMEF